MGNWATSLRVETVPQSDLPKPITFVYPYYRNAQFLRTQLAWWGTYPAHLRAHLSVILVDDGSPDPAADVLAGLVLPCPVRLFRVCVDVPWNWLAARNIGAHHAADGWLLLTDMDHVVPASTLDSLVYGRHDPDAIYAFSRIEHTGEAIAPHSASWFMTRSTFWYRIGGYDEALSGHYGSDGEYRRRATAAAPVHLLSDRLIRHEYVEDSSTTEYARKLPADTEAVRAIVASRGAGWRPKVLSFPYTEVTL